MKKMIKLENPCENASSLFQYPDDRWTSFHAFVVWVVFPKDKYIHWGETRKFSQVTFTQVKLDMKYLLVQIAEVIYTESEKERIHY